MNNNIVRAASNPIANIMPKIARAQGLVLAKPLTATIAGGTATRMKIRIRMVIISSHHLHGRTSAIWGRDTLWRVPSSALFAQLLCRLMTSDFQMCCLANVAICYGNRPRT